MKIYAALIMLVLSPLVIAGDYLHRRCAVPTVVTKNHHRDLYYFSGGEYYKYTGGNHGQVYYHENGYYYPYKETVVLVPKAIQVEVQRDHYYSIDGAAQQSLLADAIVGRLLRLQAEGRGSSPAGTGRLPTGPAVKPSPTGDDSKVDTQEPKAGDYQNEALLKVVTDSCVKCHGAGSRYTKLVTADGKLNDLPAGKIWECFGLVNSGEMPKGGKALGDAEVKLFYEWAKNARK